MSKIKREELGRGIGALLRNIEEEVNTNPQKVVNELTSNIALIDIEMIEVNPWQPRYDFDEEALKELAESIKVHGLIQPITLRRLNDKKFQLISGERRTRASKLAGLKEIPAYIRIANDQEMLEMALVENIQREDLNSIEVAITFQRLVDECNLTHEMLSDRVGKKRSTVTNFLRLLKLPPEIQFSIKNKQISMGHARALVGVDDLALQLMLHKRIIKEHLSVRDIEDIIRKYSDSKSKKTEKVKEVDHVHKQIQDMLSAFFGSKVMLKRKPDGKGQITVNFNSDDELNRILDAVEEKN
jgi:ParB family transcriptional regulator, chromosome partitioning protein